MGSSEIHLREHEKDSKQEKAVKTERKPLVRRNKSLTWLYRSINETNSQITNTPQKKASSYLEKEGIQSSSTNIELATTTQKGISKNEKWCRQINDPMGIIIRHEHEK